MKISLKISAFLSLLSLAGVLVAVGYLGFKNCSGSTNKETIHSPEPVKEVPLEPESRTVITYEKFTPYRQKDAFEYFSYYFPVRVSP